MIHELTTPEKEAINDSDIEFFEETKYSQEKRENFLYCAVATDRLEVIKYFMEQGITIKDGECLCSLFSKKTKQATIDYLASMNVDFDHREGMILVYAAKANNPRGVNFMAKKITEIDSKTISMALSMLVREHEEDIIKTEKILDILLPKLSSDGFNKLLQRFNPARLKNHEFNTKYLLNHYLTISLINENKSIVTMKI